MKTRAWVSCLLSGYWVLACGGEGPPDEPPEPSAPEDEVSVIATAEAVSAAAATNGSGGTSSEGSSSEGSSSEGSASADTSGSSGTQATTAAAPSTSASGTSAVGGASSASSGASSASGSAATDASTNGQGGAAGAAATNEGSGSSTGVDAASGTTAEGTASGTSDAGVGGDSSTAGDPITTGEVVPVPVPLGAVLITEYVESSSDNKAIEISNLGPVTLSLAECRLETYFNGNLESTGGSDLTVELAPQQSWVLCNSKSDSALLAACDQPATSGLNFNGNDAIVLRCNGVVHDSFGQVGADPGTEWRSFETTGTETTGAVDPAPTFGTVDHVLRRRCGALPRTEPTAEFEPALTDDWVNIWGFHGTETTGVELEGLGLGACAE